ncbi:MAG: hypothetical protein FD165_2356 [Gammaproteobacteria bacterium]|nr:MAG: hypothetical protein FD165_2356 [Gammaproteobacteria bacterium]TND01945.1 MAG: hypothetical protein FD120_2473 [Gammaproteobacteria bacterium]
MSNRQENYATYNYCVSFIDLLGQREALHGQGLLPVLNTDADREAFLTIIRESIGAIIRLQRDAETMVKRVIEPDPNSPFRSTLSDEERVTWDAMQFTRLTTQRWSDGLVSFVSLGDRDIKCLMNGIYSIFCLSGTLCFLGLTRGKPVRGAIDVAWGMELHVGELYGPAVVRAYELESEVAQYPRIVVSSRTIQFLQACSRNTDTDPFSRFNRALADLCLKMLIPDADGSWTLHYLGESFRWSVTQDNHVVLYNEAYAFVMAQLRKHQDSGNSKLAFRYSHLMGYFYEHPPPTEEQSSSRPR